MLLCCKKVALVNSTNVKNYICKCYYCNKFTFSNATVVKKVTFVNSTVVKSYVYKCCCKK